MTAKLMEGKKGIVLGVANRHSIAWAITEALLEAGAEVALTYEGERVADRVKKLSEGTPIRHLYPCDVSRDDDLQALFAQVQKDLGAIDFLVHSVAYAPREALASPFHQIPREGFQVALDISAYSLIGLCRYGSHLFRPGTSILTLTYHGSQQVMPGYGVMGVAKAALEAAVRYLAADLGERGIRVNALSAGPINTLAARGVPGFTDSLRLYRERSPLKKNTEPEELGQAALFLLSPMSRGITGEVLYVDGGFHVTGA
ncbi:MAG: enoyl-ACP reductase [Clostridiales bacterium]|nr:enoyl-ACP reductase [Clostridiales bacterium]